MEWSLYDIIRMAYRSHLLARTDSDFRDLAGVTFETVRDRRDDDASMQRVYKSLEKKCKFYEDKDLRELVGDYLIASEACAGVTVKWEGRKQAASRRRFLRGLFRKLYNPASKFITADDKAFDAPEDEALFNNFFPDGVGGEYAIDPVFVILITFNIIKPLKRNAMRCHDLMVEDLERSLKDMISLVEVLKDDYPEFQLVSKPMVFNIALDILRGKLRSIDDSEERAQCSYLWFHFLLKDILDTCKGISSPKNLVDAGVGTTGYRMPGIWIDDRDKGNTRFWIFPDNLQMAFCYTLHGESWILDPFEFVVNITNGEVQDTCSFITANGNRQVLFGKDHVIDPAEIACLLYKTGERNKDGLFDEILFESTGGDLPGWFDWRGFTRLKAGDALHKRFMDAIKEIYDRSSLQSLVLFRNRGQFMTDVMNSLVGMDHNYLYVWDMPRPDRFLLRMDSGERCFYEWDYDREEPKFDLMHLEISEKHPLYVIPRWVPIGKQIGSKGERFIEAAANTSMDDQISIYCISEPATKMLFFNKYAIFAILDQELPELERYGVRRINSRRDFWGMVNG